MKHSPFLLFLLLVTWSAFVLAGDAVKPDVATLLQDWRNPQRGNEVMPVKIDYPSAGRGPWPVVIMSHGLGGSRQGLQYIGEYFAAHGYVAIHLQHVGSDQSVFATTRPADRLATLTAAANAQQFIRRIGDVRFALDQISTINQDATSALHGLLDVDRIAIAGHSFGAVTAEAMCGELLGPKNTNVYDPRIKAGIIYSPSAPKTADPRKAFSKIAVPMFHWTGTRDDSPIARDTKAKDRRIPFDNINTTDQYLVILEGGDHMIFNGRVGRMVAPNPKDDAWKDLITRGSVAFLDAYLKDDAKALVFLRNEFGDQAKALGVFEKKITSARTP